MSQMACQRGSFSSHLDPSPGFPSDSTRSSALDAAAIELECGDRPNVHQCGRRGCSRVGRLAEKGLPGRANLSATLAEEGPNTCGDRRLQGLVRSVRDKSASLLLRWFLRKHSPLDSIRGRLGPPDTGGQDCFFTLTKCQTCRAQGKQTPSLCAGLAGTQLHS